MRNDVTYVAVMIAFFAVAALFVIVCDKIIGPDAEALAASSDESEPEADAQEIAA